jgi:hypothetical protein
MHVPRPVPAPAPQPGSFQALWSHQPTHPLKGLNLARERGWLLAWDEKDWLYLYKQDGDPQGQLHWPRRLTAACCAEDGSALAAIGSNGEIAWLTPDLRISWEYTISHPAVAAALDPFGQYLAVSDARGDLHVFDKLGRPFSRSQSPRPLHHLTFVPAAPFLLGASDFGLVACFDIHGRLIWRDGLVAHIGSLSVSGDGAKIVLACFTDGLLSYTLDGKKQGRLAVSEPYRLALLSFDGERTLIAGLSTKLQVLDPGGTACATHILNKPPMGIAFSALGDRAFVCQVNGALVGLALI